MAFNEKVYPTLEKAFEAVKLVRVLGFQIKPNKLNPVLNDIVLGDNTTVEFSEDKVDSSDLPTHIIDVQYLELGEIVNTIAIRELVNVEVFVNFSDSTREVDLPKGW